MDSNEAARNSASEALIEGVDSEKKSHPDFINPATGSLLCGLLSIILAVISMTTVGPLCFVGLILAVGAVVLSVFASRDGLKGGSVVAGRALGIIGLVFNGIVIAMGGCSGGIAMPESSYSYDNVSLNVAQMKLEGLGFTDITTFEVPNDKGSDDDGEVCRVSINGDPEFDEGQRFPADAKVNIAYYAPYPEERIAEDEAKAEQEAKENQEKMAKGTFGEDGFLFQILDNGTAEVIGMNSDETWVYIPDTAAGVEVTRIGDGAFKGNVSIESVDLPWDMTEIGDSAFEGCTSLDDLSFPMGLVSVGANAFKDCVSLTTVTFYSDLTNIGDSAFEGCTDLSSVSMPDGVSIGANAFANCPKLENPPA